jgi:hypothetical protein
MEAQHFKRFRAVRIVPLYRPEVERLLVGELQHIVQIDNDSLSTAPYRFGQQFSILGVGQTESLLETSLLGVTDAISHKALLENVYVKVGDQYIRAEVNAPLKYMRSNYRTVELEGGVTFSTTIDSYTRDVHGKILNVLDPFTSAGIKITLEAKIGGSINLELADTFFYTSHIEALFTFPDAPSLQEEAIRKQIHQDLTRIALEQVGLVGYDLDADRVNELRAPKYVSQENLQAVAADMLASRYRTSPEYHPV